jgi:hypothetical protein
VSEYGLGTLSVISGFSPAVDQHFSVLNLSFWSFCVVSKMTAKRHPSIAAYLSLRAVRPFQRFSRPVFRGLHNPDAFL